MPSEPAVGGAPLPGTVIDGKYVVGEVIARGGMGCLVDAEQELLNRTVAIKFVLAERGPTARGRLLREARAMQALTSEHVVRVFDLGVYDEAPYIVMERLEGEDLGDKVEHDGPLPIAEAVDAVLEAAVALAEAHALGIVHRDVKPSNLFLARTRSRELVKVLDFGISKIAERAADEDLEETTEDAVLGTPFYMAPEQIRNPATIDGRADVWALAVTLFYLLTSEHPFVGKTSRQITASIFTDEPAKLTERIAAPVALERAIEGALEKRPARRTPSIADFVEALVPFASKRGRDAAARVEATTPEVPVRERATPAGLMTAATTTQDGLASTQRTPAEEGSASGRGEDRPPSEERWPAVAIGVGLALAGLVAWGWIGATTGSPPVRGSAPAHGSVALGGAPPDGGDLASILAIDAWARARAGELLNA